MVTFAQAQERAEEWVNGDVPAYQHREVRVREFELGFVVWAEDRQEGPTSDGGRQRLVIARDSGEATLWPGLPVGEVIRRYEEEYGAPAEIMDADEAAAPQRIDLEQTSFLLTPPEWLQDAADKMGIPDRRSGAPAAGAAGSRADASADAPVDVPLDTPMDAPADVPVDAPVDAVVGVNGPSVDAGSQPSAGNWADSVGAGANGAQAGAGSPPPGAGAGAGVAGVVPGAGTPSGAGAGVAGAGAVPGAAGGAGGIGLGGPKGRVGSRPADDDWPGAGGVAGASGGPGGAAGVGGAAPSPAPSPAPNVPPPAGSWSQQGGNASQAERSSGGAAWPSAGGSGGDYEPTSPEGVPASMPGVPVGATPWAGIDTNADADSDDASVPLPATVYAPMLSGSDDDDVRPPGVPPEAKTSLISGGSRLPATSVAPALPGSAAAPGAGPQPSVSPMPPAAPAGPARPGQGPGDISDAATSKAAMPPRGARGGGSTTPPPPGAPGTPGVRPGGAPAPSGPGAPGAPAGGYVPTQFVSQLGPDGPQTSGPPGPPSPPPGGGVHHAATMFADASQGGGMPSAPQPPGPPGPPSPPSAGGGVHHAATMFADPSQGGGMPGFPQPPGPPGAPGAGGPHPPGPPGVPGAGGPQPPGPPGAPGAGTHQAATMFAGPGQVGPPPGGPQPPGPPGMPGGGPPQPHMPQGQMPQPPLPQGHMPQHQGAQRPPAYGYPQQPTGLPTVGPGYQAVLRYRGQDGSEQQLIRRSAPGTPHPEWQILHELRAMNVPPQQVLELHTELESCELPGGYCARMIRETWPQVRITSVAPYGTDHSSRQQGMQHLLTHQGELHQVADGPARPAPMRAPLPHPSQVMQAPPIPPEGVAHELAGAFGPQGVFRFDQGAVSRQGVPEIVARTLVWAGLPVDFGPFFWAQAVPGQPVPTLAELATQRGVQPASDAGSYLVMGSDFGRAICVQYGTAHIVAVPVEAGPGGQPVPPQFVNTGLPEFARSLALLGRMWRLRFGLNPEQAGRWTVDFQAQLVALDPAALASPESWWSVLLEQMWDGLL